MPLALLASIVLAKAVPNTGWSWFGIRNSREIYGEVVRVWAPPMRTRHEFRREGEAVYANANRTGESSTYPKGDVGIYTHDSPGFHVAITTVPIAIAKSDPSYTRSLIESKNGKFDEQRNDLFFERTLATYPAEEGRPEDPNIRKFAVWRLDSQPVRVEVAASPENWAAAENLLRHVSIGSRSIYKWELIHPLWFKGRTLPWGTGGKIPPPTHHQGGFTYLYTTPITSVFGSFSGTCRLDVDETRGLSVESIRKSFTKVDLEEAFRIGTGATWLHMRGTGSDGLPTELMATRTGSTNVVARLSVPKDEGLPGNADLFTGVRGNETKVKETVGEDMFERNGIVSPRVMEWTDGVKAWVNALYTTASGPKFTLATEDRDDLTTTVTYAVDPFLETHFRSLESEMEFRNRTKFILHGVREDGSESYVYDADGQYNIAVMKSVVLRRPSPPMLVESSHYYILSNPYWETLAVADPVKGWVPIRYPGSDLPKGFAYYRVEGNPRRDGLWVDGNPGFWRVENPPKDEIWSAGRSKYAIHHFWVDGGKLEVYGLPYGWKLDDGKVLRRLEAWARDTKSVLSKTGRWEKTTARGQPYDVYKTTATRDGVERDVWHYRGPKIEVREEQYTFLLECKASDAASRDAWLKRNETPPPPMRRTREF